MEAEIYAGSCLCGTVRFEFAGPPVELLHCHCAMCRKAHGAPYATFARVPHAAFRFLEGDDAVVAYRSSPEAYRTFCGRCGSALQFVRDGGETFGLALSALDTLPEPEPVREVWTDTKLDWLVPGR